MIGFSGTSLQLHLIITAHTLNSFWTTSVWRMNSWTLSLSLMLRPMFSRPLCFGIKHPSGVYDHNFITVSCGFVDVGCSLWREGKSVAYNCCWPSPAQSFSDPSPVGLATIFYCYSINVLNRTISTFFCHTWVTSSLTVCLKHLCGHVTLRRKQSCVFKETPGLVTLILIVQGDSKLLSGFP
jgi:hypothetical protein